MIIIKRTKGINKLVNKITQDVVREMPWMEGSNVDVKKQSSDYTKDMVAHVYGDTHEAIDVNQNDYYIVSMSKELEIEGGGTIPKIVKVHVENGKVSNIIESR